MLIKFSNACLANMLGARVLATFAVKSFINGIKSGFFCSGDRPVRCWRQIIHGGERFAASYEGMEFGIIDPRVPDVIYFEFLFCQ